VKGESSRARAGAVGRGSSKPVPSLLTDLIFVSIAAYLLLNYARMLLAHVETTLLIIRETFLITYLLMALTFLGIRKGAKAFTGRNRNYLYTILGFSSPLLLQPTPRGGPLVVGAPLEFVGLALVVASFLSLNRSFGLAPENRGIKTGGVYRLVRHPMYLGYILANAGYAFDNASTFNLFILTISVLFLLLRLRAEEQLLQQDRAYRSYARKTRWKLIPLVF
jgi:protein-S-isoprenylcysteine O-methyltransferase Ste14